MTVQQSPSPAPLHKPRGFVDDFKRFFLRGLAAVMPTLVTLWLLIWAWNFLWGNLGQYIIVSIRKVWFTMVKREWVDFETPHYIVYYTNPENFTTRLIGVLLSIILIYFLGVFVGNLIGRTFWLFAERAVLRIPLIRAIYPAVKQVTDFVLADHAQQFRGSRVVACQPHADQIWSIGLVTGSAEWGLNDRGPEEMVTVFVPSTPTSISGYVLVVPRSKVVELPMTVEEAMRLLVSGGVIMPGDGKTFGQHPSPLPDQRALESEPQPAPQEPTSVAPLVKTGSFKS